MKFGTLLNETARTALALGGQRWGGLLVLLIAAIALATPSGPAQLIGGLALLVSLSLLLRDKPGLPSPKDVGMSSARLGLSGVLIGIILSFLAVMTLMAAGLAAFAIMAGSGFDFDAASQSQAAYDAQMQAYRETPGWQLAMAVFFVAMFILALGIVRAAPVAAASVHEKRIVALEGFNWTRGHALRHLGVSLILIAPAMICAVFVPVVSETLWGRGMCFAIGVYGFGCLSLASYRLLRETNANSD